MLDDKVQDDRVMKSETGFPKWELLKIYFAWGIDFGVGGVAV